MIFRLFFIALLASPANGCPDILLSGWTPEPPSWKDYGTFFLLQGFQTYLNDIGGLEEIETSRHPIIRTARELGLGKKEGGGLFFPTLADSVAGYHALLPGRLAEFGLTDADAIYPARTFLTKETFVANRSTRGFEHLLSWPNEPDAGWVECISGPSPREMGKMLKQGFHIVDGGKQAIHDMYGHFGGFLEYPLYMAKLRRVISAPKKIPPLDFYLRYLYLIEGLELVPASKKQRLLDVLGPPFSDSDELITVATVEAYLQTLSLEKLEARAARLLAEVPDLVDRYGGSSRDTPFMHAYAKHPEMRATIGALIYELFHALTVFQYYASAENRTVLIGWLARLQVLMQESSRIAMPDFIDQLMGSVFPLESDVYRMFVRSGAGMEPGEIPSLMMRSLGLGGLDELDSREFTFKEI